MKLIDKAQPDIGILIKEQDVHPRNKANLMFRYVQKLGPLGVKTPGSRVEFIGLEYPTDPKKKPRKADAMVLITEILTYCDTVGITTLLVPDSEYFKHLTKRTKLEDSIDGVYKCAVPDYEHLTILPSIHYNAIAVSPPKEALLEKSLKVLAMHLTGTYEPPGANVLKNYTACHTAQELKTELNKLMQQPELTCDIEATSLKFHESKLLTIGFSQDQNSATVCAVHETYHNIAERDLIHDILRRFFKAYKGKIWFHNVLFDVKQLTYQLFMNGLGDLDGMQEGLDAFNNVHDTMIVAYLAKNSTMRTPLGLKELSKEYMGEYAEDVKEAIKIPLDDLMKYNGKDCCATWYVLNTYRPIMVADEQMNVYNKIFQPSIKPLIKMMLTGLPLDLSRTEEAKKALQEKLDTAVGTLHRSHHVKRAVSVLKYNAAEKYNATHKVKQKTADEIELDFNPNSADQLRLLIFEILGFDIIEKTKAGKGSTKREFIEEWLKEAKADGDEDVVECLQALVDVSQISIIINTFISAFENLNVQHSDGQRYLAGNLRLGGTQSGRLSSSEPNMQNLPSGSTYGKIIKSCFVAPDNWVFFGADFSALEDRIGAILSGDEAKTKEFAHGFDGHSLRALAFFPEELPEGMSIDSLEDNSTIKKEFGGIRGKSKGPSFAMQYGCGPGKIQQLLKCSKSKADEVYSAYHNLYSGLNKFAQGNKNFGIQNGYVEGAFGLRLRTPLLKRHQPGSRESNEVGTEARSASNMVTQSWGMLMNRAFIEFNDVLEDSDFTKDVVLTNTIHDAVYGLCRATPEVMKFVNDTLVKSMQWQEDKVASDKVLMEAEVDFGKNWRDQETLHNGATKEEIKEFLKDKLDIIV